MTISEFLTKKNAILKKYSDIDLIPPEQIIEPNVAPGGIERIKETLSFKTDGLLCPYCILYDLDYDQNHPEFIDEPLTRCTTCPMSLQDNNCHHFLTLKGQEPTYRQMIEFLKDSYNTLAIVDKRNPWREELEQLVEEFKE